MDVGFLTEIVHREPGDNRPLVELYDEAFELAEWFESLGLDSCSSASTTSWRSSGIPRRFCCSRDFLGAPEMHLGMNVLLTPFTEPVRLAETLPRSI